MIFRKKWFYIFSVLILGLFISMYFNVKRLYETKVIMAQLDTKNSELAIESASFEGRQKKFITSLKSEVFEVTAYDKSPLSCGKWAQYGKTKTGTKPNSLRTVAVDPDIIPLGSIVYIEGIGWRIAEDTGRLIKGKSIDVFFDSYEDALEFGRKNIKVYYNGKSGYRIS
jgi:3D (Asp-Asp-Asp) domain-containing protein